MFHKFRVSVVNKICIPKINSCGIICVQKMPIKIFNEQHKIKLDVCKIRKYLPLVEKKMFLPKDDGYNIIFLDDKNIKKLNSDFRNTDLPTDVLSFKNEANKKMQGFRRVLTRLSKPDASHRNVAEVLTSVSEANADIFISVETAKSNAKLYGQKFYTEILRLIIHGILHSMDYTDYTEKAKKIMWEKQERILKCLR